MKRNKRGQRPVGPELRGFRLRPDQYEFVAGLVHLSGLSRSYVARELLARGIAHEVTRNYRGPCQWGAAGYHEPCYEIGWIPQADFDGDYRILCAEHAINAIDGMKAELKAWLSAQRRMGRDTAAAERLAATVGVS
jgi:hypothetical protein